MKLIIAESGCPLHEVPEPSWHVVELAVTHIDVGRSELCLWENDGNNLRITRIGTSGAYSCVLCDRGHRLLPQVSVHSPEKQAWVKASETEPLKPAQIHLEAAVRVARWFWEHHSMELESNES